jgi:hypothetical protein
MFRHNVVAKRNMTISWILKMANVLAKNNGAWHTPLAAPIKLVGALGLGIKLGTFLDIPLEIDTPMGLGMEFVNTNVYGNHT